jgi:hypothetical protein
VTARTSATTARYRRAARRRSASRPPTPATAPHPSGFTLNGTSCS